MSVDVGSKSPLLQRIDRLSTIPRDLWLPEVVQILEENLDHETAERFQTQDNCVEAIYGDGGTDTMWRQELSVPIRCGMFASLLAAMRSDDRLRSVFRFMEVERVLATGLAKDEPEVWFLSGARELTTTQKVEPFATRELMIDGLQAAKWLLSHENRAWIVPDSLAAFLSTACIAAVENCQTIGSDKPSQAAVNEWVVAYYQRAADNKRRPPKKEAEVFAAARAAINARQAQVKAVVIPAALLRGKGDRDR